MEDGIAEAGGGALVVTYSEEGTVGSLDKTWNEIKAAYPNVTIYAGHNAPDSEYWYSGTEIYVDSISGLYGVMFGSRYNLTATNPDDYPTVSYD